MATLDHAKGALLSLAFLLGQLLLSSLGQTHKLMQLSSLAPIDLKGRGRRRYLPQHPDDERLFSFFVCTQEAPVRLTQVCGCSGPRCSACSSCPAFGLLVTLQLYVGAHFISTSLQSRKSARDPYLAPAPPLPARSSPLPVGPAGALGSHRKQGPLPCPDCADSGQHCLIQGTQ